MQGQVMTIEQEIEMNAEKHRSAYSRIQALIDRMLELYQQAQQNLRTGRDHQIVISELNQQLLTLRPLKTVRQHFIHYYRKLSSLIRRLQNDNRTSNMALSRQSKKKYSNATSKEQQKNDRFKQFFSSFISSDKERKSLEKMIAGHFLREGKFESAEVWEDATAEIDVEVYRECHRIKDRVSKGFFQEALSWCQSERIFETKANRLEFQLAKTQIVSLVNSGKAQEAVSYFKSKMPKYSSSCRQEIQELMGFILFRSQSYWSPSLQQFQNLMSHVNERYKKFVSNQEKCEELAQLFLITYLKQHKVSQFDVLKIVYNCSRKISDEYQRLMHLTWESQRGRQQSKEKYLKQLPFSLKVDNTHQYHSLFLCPVTKEVHTSGDVSVLLSCGHMISQAAHDRIVLESRNRRKVKCPICQKDILPKDSLQVDF